jgi:hypothetical protein
MPLLADAQITTRGPPWNTAKHASIVPQVLNLYTLISLPSITHARLVRDRDCNEAAALWIRHRYDCISPTKSVQEMGDGVSWLNFLCFDARAKVNRELISTARAYLAL